MQAAAISTTRTSSSETGQAGSLNACSPRRRSCSSAASQSAAASRPTSVATHAGSTSSAAVQAPPDGRPEGQPMVRSGAAMARPKAVLAVWVAGSALGVLSLGLVPRPIACGGPRACSVPPQPPHDPGTRSRCARPRDRAAALRGLGGESVQVLAGCRWRGRGLHQRRAGYYLTRNGDRAAGSA